MHVKDVLAHKGAAVATVTPGALITEVIAALAEHHVGALVVTSDGRTIEGIVSERDVVRALHTRGAELLGTQVREIMTVNVLTSSPDDEVRSLAKTMTENDSCSAVSALSL